MRNLLQTPDYKPSAVLNEIEQIRSDNERLRQQLAELRQEADLIAYRMGRTGMIHSVYRFKLIYSIGGLVLGGISMILGSVLFMFGVTGSTAWTANILGAESNLTDAAPGAVLFVVGLFMVIVTRFRMKIETSSGSEYESH